ncbi:MAG: fused MFS/spermidine synthase [Limnochordales bacterium]|nr:fused MFS/spermidine synthase [Limnochordales bacterium]
MLYVIVFLSGAVLMGLEMIGSRLLAPTFGTSIYVWGALITVVMTALTLGYYLGGRIADRRPSLSAMGIILAAAGLLIGFLPLWSVPVNRSLAELGPRAGSLIAALVFFFLPSTLLAAISPYSVKLASHSLTTIGGTAGRLSAISSAGSILGTLITSFFLIPALGVRNIIHMLGLILLLLAAATFLAAAQHRRMSRTLATASLLVAILLILAWRFVPLQAGPHAPGTARLLYSRDTLYHNLTVDQEGDVRHLHFDNSYQSAIYVNDPLRMAFAYTSYLHLGVVACPQPRSALFIGLGGGSAPSRFLHDYPSLEQVDVVEIDPEVVKVARRFFQLPADPRLKITVQDGRLFVEKKQRKIRQGEASPYDIIVVDAYFADAIPYHLTTREFVESLAGILSPDGVVVSNIIGALAGDRSQLLRAMTRTFASVFAQVYLFPVGGWYGKGDWEERNVILVANRSDRRLSRQEWVEKAHSLRETGEIKEDVHLYATTLVESPEWTDRKQLERAPLLTDDFAPVDTLQHPL